MERLAAASCRLRDSNRRPELYETIATKAPPATPGIQVDNAGAIAYIWQYEISSRVLRKIVPEHESRNQQVLRYQRREYIV